MKLVSSAALVTSPLLACNGVFTRRVDRFAPGVEATSTQRDDDSLSNGDNDIVPTSGDAEQSKAAFQVSVLKCTTVRILLSHQVGCDVSIKTLWDPKKKTDWCNHINCFTKRFFITSFYHFTPPASGCRCVVVCVHIRSSASSTQQYEFPLFELLLSCITVIGSAVSELWGQRCDWEHIYNPLSPCLIYIPVHPAL